MVDEITDRELARASRLAGELYAAGRFAEAEPLYRRLHRRQPGDAAVLLRLVSIALHRNRPGWARRWLRCVESPGPAPGFPGDLLADICQRNGDLAAAAGHLRAAGLAARADNLESFVTTGCYRGRGDTPARVEWLAGEPLPLIVAEIEGQEVHLILDTGTGETVIDAALAQRLKIPLSGCESGHVAGGGLARVCYGHLYHLGLGALQLEHIPVQVQPIGQHFAAFFPGCPVHGIFGTALMSRFVTTLDYRGGAMLLDAPAREAGGGQRVVDFWLAGDLRVVVEARLDGDCRTLLFLDTGMAGAAVAVPVSTWRLLGSPMDGSGLHAGVGAGGGVRAARFMLDSLRLGEELTRHLPGLILGAFPLERRFGFRIGGLLGHDFFRNRVVTLDFRRMQMRLD